MKTVKKLVTETKAGKSISAFIILNSKGELIAKVHSHYSEGGTVSTDIWEMGKGITFQGKAGGYGYDKFTASIRGAIIDNHKIYDHSSNDNTIKQILEDYLNDLLTLEQAKQKANSIGAEFANYSSEKQKYTSIYYEDGLNRLTMLGYKVIQAF